MVAQSCGAMAFGVMKTTIDHESTRMECCRRVPFGKRMVIGYHSGTLMYTNLCHDKSFDRRKGKGLSI